MRAKESQEPLIGHGAPCLAYLALNRLPVVNRATKQELYQGLVKGRAFLAKNYRDGTSFKLAAEAACMSPYHFNRLFRDLFRESPHQFVIGLRLYNARKLLRTSSLSMGEIAVAMGFQQLSSFSRQFRQRYAMSPSEYRRKEAVG